MHVLNYLDEMKSIDEIPEMGNTKAKLEPQEISREDIGARIPNIFHKPNMS
jgi:hypothetical protein